MYSANLFGIQMDTVYGLYLEDYAVPAPEVQTNYVEVVRRDGAIDKTAPDGVVRYKDREWESLIFSKTGDDVSGDDLQEFSATIMNAIHGRSGNIIFDDDSNYKWIGRAFVNKVDCENNGKIIVDVNLITQPYKIGLTAITKAVTLSSTEQNVTLKNGRKPLIPKIVVTNSAQVKFTLNGTQKTLNFTQGTYNNSDLILFEGNTIVTVSGQGTITFEYPEMSL